MAKALGRVRDGFGKPLILEMQVSGTWRRQKPAFLAPEGARAFQAVIKSAASAASPTMAQHADGGARGLPCKSREAALAADLITA